MRIAYLCGDPGIPVLGDKGAAVHVRELIGGFATLGHEVTLFAGRVGSGSEDELRAALVPVGGEQNAARDAREREWQLSRENQHWGHVLDTAHRHAPFDLVYERASLWLHAGAAFARRHALPYVVEVNSPLRDEQRRYRSLSWEVRAVRVERYVFGSATRVVAVSEAVADHVRRASPRPDHVSVVENGVDLARYRTDSMSRRSAAFTIGFLGSLKPWHGVDLLLAAAARLVEQGRDVRVLIVGDGPEASSLVRLAHSLGIGDAVEFVGAVPKRDVPEWLSAMDVAVAPYPALDGFYFSPLKLYDYMASGRAIVASRVGSIANVIRDGETGLLVAPGDVDALADACERLRVEPPFAQRLGRAARADALAHHGWHARAASILDLLSRTSASGRVLPFRSEVPPCRIA